jgi:arylamine N-acetyltransferase
MTARFDRLEQTHRLIRSMAGGLTEDDALRRMRLAQVADPVTATLPARLAPAQVGRYLRLLGVPAGAPSPERLRLLVRSQLLRVPFENVSKLYHRRQEGRRDVPGIDAYLDGIERHRFGGTCYANNLHFWGLLQALGYDAVLCGADMPSGPDVHAATRVRLEGRDFLVDVGYAAPFYEPIPLDLPRTQAIRFGRDCYLVHPRDSGGRSTVELWRDGARVHGYVLNPRPRTAGHFGRAIRDSFRPRATFMRSLLLVRAFEGRTVTVLNRLRIDSWPDDFRLSELPCLDRVVAEIVTVFDMDEEVVRLAVSGIAELDSPYG